MKTLTDAKSTDIRVTKCVTKYGLAMEPSRRFCYFVATEPSISLFLSFMPTKALAPFSLHTPQKKPSFKPINDQFIVAGICRVQLNEPTLDFGQ